MFNKKNFETGRNAIVVMFLFGTMILWLVSAILQGRWIPYDLSDPFLLGFLSFLGFLLSIAAAFCLTAFAVGALIRKAEGEEDPSK